MSKKIAVIGECMIELSEKNGAVNRGFGGDTLNTSVYIARQTDASALSVHYVTALGTDAFSQQMLDSWQQENVNTDLIQRMDEAFVSSCDISLNKAWSACSLKQGTHEITPAVQPGQSLYGLQLTNQQRIIIFGGGLPVIFNEQVIGAVGVSGGTVEQDQLLAQCALDCFSAL